MEMAEIKISELMDQLCIYAWEDLSFFQEGVDDVMIYRILRNYWLSPGLRLNAGYKTSRELSFICMLMKTADCISQNVSYFLQQLKVWFQSPKCVLWGKVFNQIQQEEE